MKDKVRVIDGNYLYERFKSNGLKDEWVYRFIEEEPTVDAIPVKWIENWVKETYPITEDWKDYMVSFGELIEAWEAENESNR